MRIWYGIKITGTCADLLSIAGWEVFWLCCHFSSGVVLHRLGGWKAAREGGRVFEGAQLAGLGKEGAGAQSPRPKVLTGGILPGMSAP